MKRRKLTRWEWALFATPLLSLVAMCLLSGEPLVWRFPQLAPREQARKRSCQNNLKQLGLAISMYVNEFDAYFPPAKIGSVLRPAKIGGAPTRGWNPSPPNGWADAILPYLGANSLNLCPSDYEPYFGPTTANATHYFYNANLSAYPYNNIQDNRRGAIIVFGEGSVGNDTYSKTALPPQWLRSYKSPCYRHLGGANYLFVDWHVKWLRPREISSAPGAAHTFSTR